MEWAYHHYTPAHKCSITAVYKSTYIPCETSGMLSPTDTLRWRGRDWKLAHTMNTSPSVTTSSPGLDRYMEAPDKGGKLIKVLNISLERNSHRTD
jgi:hypothetical protein